MRLDPECKPEREPRCAWNVLGDQTLIIHPTLGTITSVNGTGAEVWDLCDGATSVRQIVGRLRERYEDDGRIEATVEGFLSMLHEIDLLAGQAPRKERAIRDQGGGEPVAFPDLVRRASLEAVPLTAHLMVTERCGQRCAHCYLPPLRGQNELSLAEINDLLGQLRSAGTLFVVISGGEPRMRADFLDILSLVRRHRLALRLYTNGSAIGPPLAQAISELGPLSVEVSLYGSSTETHEAVSCAPGSFERTVRAIGELCALGVRVIVKMPVTRHNIRDRQATRRLVESLGAEMAPTSVYLFPPEGKLSRLTEMGPSDEDLTRTLSETDPPPDCEAGRQAVGGLCGAGRSYVHVGSDGGVSPCPLFPDPVGNVRNQSFQQIWREASLFKALRALSPRDLVECSSCELVSSCERCTATAYRLGGAITAADPIACRISRLRYKGC